MSNMETVHYYTTNISWQQGRIGKLESNGFDTITVATPPEFPKGVPNLWSPEHLFVASINVCLMTTFLSIAENSKLGFVSYSAEAKGKLEKSDGKFMITEVEVIPRITVNLEKDIERAERIVHKAEEHCLISNSVKTKISLKPLITKVEE